MTDQQLEKGNALKEERDALQKSLVQLNRTNGAQKLHLGSGEWFYLTEKEG